MTLGSKIGIGRTAEVFDWGDHQIIKLYYADFPIDDIQRELDVARVAHQAGVKTPAVGNLVEVDGRTGVIYERIDGKTLLNYMLAKPWRVHSFAKQMATLHTSLHKTPAQDMPTQFDRFRSIIQRHFDGNDQTQLLDYLNTLPDGDMLCHGDFHPDNIIFSESGELVVIDWMNGTQGPALADVARTSLMLTIGAPPDSSFLIRLVIWVFRQQFHRSYITQYCQLSGYSRADIERWMPIVAAVRIAENIIGEEQYLQPLIAQVINQ